MGGKGKLFLRVQSQLINVRGMMEIESHYLANTTVLTVSVKNHQWMLKLVGYSMMEKRVFTQFSSYLPTR